MTDLPPLTPPPAAHLHPRIVPWQHALAWYEDAMRLFKRGAGDVGGARGHHDRRRVRVAARAIARPAARRNRFAARRLRPHLRGSLRRSRRTAGARRRDQGVSRSRGRDGRDRRVRARHVRGSISRRMVDRRHEPARPGRLGGRHAQLRSSSASTRSASSLRCRSCSCRFTCCWNRWRRVPRLPQAGTRSRSTPFRCWPTPRRRSCLLAFGLATFGLGFVLALPLWVASSYAAWKDIFGIRDAPEA